jgi:hypothetical protein
MIGLRVGAFLAAKKRGITFSEKPKTDAEQLQPLCEQKYSVSDRDISQFNNEKLLFRKYPYVEWVGGLWIICIALFALWLLNGEMAHLP